MRVVTITRGLGRTHGQSAAITVTVRVRRIKREHHRLSAIETLNVRGTTHRYQNGTY